MLDLLEQVALWYIIGWYLSIYTAIIKRNKKLTGKKRHVIRIIHKLLALMLVTKLVIGMMMGPWDAVGSAIIFCIYGRSWWKTRKYFDDDEIDIVDVVTGMVKSLGHRLVVVSED